MTGKLENYWQGFNGKPIQINFRWSPKHFLLDGKPRINITQHTVITYKWGNLTLNKPI